MTRIHPRRAPGVHSLAPVALAALFAACADDLVPTGGTSATARAVVTRTADDGTFATTIDASRPDAVVGFDFEGRAEVSASAGAPAVWDLGFSRFKVTSNGGVSGGGGVEVAILPDVALAAVAAAPDAGWLRDEGDGPDMNSDPDTVFNRGDDTWFAYDPVTHKLTAKPRVYVVKSAEGGFFALAMQAYYDQAGTPGHVTFRWRPIAAPAAPAAPADAAPGLTPDGLPD